MLQLCTGFLCFSGRLLGTLHFWFVCSLLCWCTYSANSTQKRSIFLHFTMRSTYFKVYLLEMQNETDLERKTPCGSSCLKCSQHVSLGQAKAGNWEFNADVQTGVRNSTTLAVSFCNQEQSQLSNPGTPCGMCLPEGHCENVL